jgi:SAM-dependent methyltransferase
MSRRQQGPVNTTTWPERHNGTFGELAGRLEAAGNLAPTVLEVGPGAVTRFLRDRLRPGEGAELSWLANRYRAFLRNLDGLLRRIPAISLCSYEPGELREALPAGAKLIVTDISPAVIEAIRRQYVDVETTVFDFAARPYGAPVDVIVCLCVLVRTAAPQAIFSNLYHSLKNGGLLVMDHRSCTTFNAAGLPLEELTPQIWRKPVA